MWSCNRVKKVYYKNCLQISWPKFWWTWVFIIKLWIFTSGYLQLQTLPDTATWDYNTRNTKWWHYDNTTTEGTQLETTATIYGMNLLIFAKIAPLVLTWFSQINQTLLSIEKHILLFMTIVNTKLPSLRPGLELNTLHPINAKSGIMQKLILME